MPEPRQKQFLKETTMAELVPMEVDKYNTLIATYDNEFKKWEARTKKIIRRYRDDTRSASGNDTAKFNILWSNVQTLIPAVYSKMPKADVSRRFGDNDPIGRVASILVERALDFEIEHYTDFRSTMRHAVEDRFLGGRGVAWVRYEPHVVQVPGMPESPEDGVQVTEDADEAETKDYTAGQVEPMEQIEYECAPTDYVHWADFGHSVARTWEEVTQVWRWVYMTKDALVERFGEEAARNIPLDSGPDPLSNYASNQREYTRAKICELWDKETAKVYWFSKQGNKFIDVRDDPLELEQFFPCCKPLYSTMTSDSLVPVPDFVLYQDQANELDILSDRIDGLVKSLRVRGVYDSSVPALQRLLTEGDNNTLIPVDKWMAFSEKGGLKGAIDLLPLDTLANALLQCYRARQEIKQQIYEITGLSDILRGASQASETATAQQIKGQFASLRLRSMQEEVALFASDLIRLKAQIICTKFQPQTILMYAGASQMQPVDQQMIPQALALIKDKPLRNFRIEVAADSLVQLDEAAMKRERTEFIGAFAGFLQQAMPVAQASPEMTPVLMEIMKFGVSAFKSSQQLEGVIDQALDQIKEKMAQPQQPKPNPEMMKLQAQQQADQMRVQADMQVAQAKAQFEAQLQQAKLQADAQQLQFTAQLESAKLEREQQMERFKAELDANTKIRVAQISHSASVLPEDMDAQQQMHATLNQDLRGMIEAMMNTVNNSHQQVMQSHNNSVGTMQEMLKNQSDNTQVMKNVADLISAPKRIVRGPDGKAVGMEVIK
jgi:F0F1-type ATP synthase membrane subunit b/b'